MEFTDNGVNNMLNHSRDMSFNRGFLKEDALQSMRDELEHRDGGYQKPPKTIHEHRMVGEAPRDFSKQEILDGLISSAEQMPSALTYCNLGRYYWKAFHNGEKALLWLKKAAGHNDPDAKELIAEIERATREHGSERQSGDTLSKAPLSNRVEQTTMPRNEGSNMARGFRQTIFQEDYNSLEKPNAAMGACYQVAVVVHDVLEGLLAAVVEHINEQLDQVLDGEIDYSGVGYEFRNAFECYCWIEKGVAQPDLFWPKYDGPSIIERAVTDAISELDLRDTEILIAWYWPELDFGRDKKGVNIVDLKDTDVFGALIPFVLNVVKRQVGFTSDYVLKRISEKRKEVQGQRDRDFEYDDEDGYILCVMQDICDACPGNALLTRALGFVEQFLDKSLPDDAEPCMFTISYRNNGESNYYSFDLNEDSLSIYSGGVLQSDCGSDTYGNEVFRLDAYSHADIDHYNLSDEIIELINMGAEISDDDI